MNFCCKFFKLKFSNESSPSLPPPVETYKVSTGGLSRVYAEKTVGCQPKTLPLFSNLLCPISTQTLLHILFWTFRGHPEFFLVWIFCVYIWYCIRMCSQYILIFPVRRGPEDSQGYRGCGSSWSLLSGGFLNFFLLPFHKKKEYFSSMWKTLTHKTLKYLSMKFLYETALIEF